MESQCVIPDNILAQLKCSLCEGYLSVPPIMVISEDGDKYKCGRCYLIKTVVSNPAIIYELLANIMLFPCNYPDCNIKIPFADVKDHEKICEHRSVICPKANCNDIIKLLKIGAHFKEKHIETYHSNSFNIKNVHAYYNIDVLEKNGKTYISLFDFDDVNFGINVCAVDPNDNYKYEVTLKSEKSHYGITVSNQSLVSFNERQHCFKCISNICKLKYHVYKDNRKEISKRLSTKINKESVKRLLGSGLITYNINIIDGDKPKEEVKHEIKDVIIRKAKKIFLQLLECPICKIYMSPPIFQCLSGHTICNSCKTIKIECPTCQESIQNTRNFTLEELSLKVELPDEKKLNSKRNYEKNGDTDAEDPPMKAQKN
ncbi:uncharacterized protein LOC130893538 [Diorhabda carinulata]|uniref:uncharacterized protein LOC130893538 n=1 Tax=Diorhabda carinulata TaxID=1163345 RepID=UPI0025A01995|nr:uncharacterized protein LOC130893538 [Diorhabda carinulata]XP_057655754.1 uncharacterized protein LOC130893538 [Diorhabda carinulata]